MARGMTTVKRIAPTIGKRTSQGRNGTPKNKHKRRSFKAYRGQGKI